VGSWMTGWWAGRAGRVVRRVGWRVRWSGSTPGASVKRECRHGLCRLGWAGLGRLDAIYAQLAAVSCPWAPPKLTPPWPTCSHLQPRWMRRLFMLCWTSQAGHTSGGGPAWHRADALLHLEWHGWQRSCPWLTPAASTPCLPLAKHHACFASLHMTPPHLPACCSCNRELPTKRIGNFAAQPNSPFPTAPHPTPPPAAAATLSCPPSG